MAYKSIVLSAVVDTSNCIIHQGMDHSKKVYPSQVPNILSLIGVSYIKGEAIPLMILPFMHNGDVKSFVKSKRGTTLKVTEFPEVCIVSSKNV